jgi:hypothetical protein
MGLGSVSWDLSIPSGVRLMAVLLVVVWPVVSDMPIYDGFLDVYVFCMLHVLYISYISPPSRSFNLFPVSSHPSKQCASANATAHNKIDVRHGVSKAVEDGRRLSALRASYPAGYRRVGHGGPK